MRVQYRGQNTGQLPKEQKEKGDKGNNKRTKEESERVLSINRICKKLKGVVWVCQHT